MRLYFSGWVASRVVDIFFFTQVLLDFALLLSNQDNRSQADMQFSRATSAFNARREGYLTYWSDMTGHFIVPLFADITRNDLFRPLPPSVSPWRLSPLATRKTDEIPSSMLPDVFCRPRTSLIKPPSLPLSRVELSSNLRREAANRRGSRSCYTTLSKLRYGKYVGEWNAYASFGFPSHLDKTRPRRYGWTGERWILRGRDPVNCHERARLPDVRRTRARARLCN